jgi:hypothetical protein
MQSVTRERVAEPVSSRNGLDLHRFLNSLPTAACSTDAEGLIVHRMTVRGSSKGDLLDR